VPIPDLDTLRSRAAALGPDAVPSDLSVRFTVSIADGDTWTLVVADGAVTVEPGRSGDVVVLLDPATAERIADGRVNAQQAIAEGGLRIEGDLDALPPARSLVTIGAILGPPIP
jgi:putative sterol carrier protein